MPLAALLKVKIPISSGANTALTIFCVVILVAFIFLVTDWRRLTPRNAPRLWLGIGAVALYVGAALVVAVREAMISAEMAERYAVLAPLINTPTDSVPTAPLAEACSGKLPAVRATGLAVLHTGSLDWNTERPRQLIGIFEPGPPLRLSARPLFEDPQQVDLFSEWIRIVFTSPTRWSARLHRPEVSFDDVRDVRVLAVTHGRDTTVFDVTTDQPRVLCGGQARQFTSTDRYRVGDAAVAGSLDALCTAAALTECEASFTSLALTVVER